MNQFDQNLQDAVNRNNILEAHNALIAGANPKNNDSLLYTAIDKNNPDMVEMLLQAGAKPNIFNITGYTPLIHVLSKNFNMTPAQKLIIVQILLNIGADPNLATTYEKRTPLMFAFPHIDIVRTLLQAGAEVNREDRYEYNELMVALNYSYPPTPELIEILLDEGLKEQINVKNNIGETALLIACRRSKNIPSIAEIVEILLNAGADVNIQDKYKNTALMNVCISYGQYDFFYDANEIDDDEFPACPAYPKIIELLLNAGANPNIMNDHDTSALTYALRVHSRYRERDTVIALLTASSSSSSSSFGRHKRSGSRKKQSGSRKKRSGSRKKVKTKKSISKRRTK